MYLVLCACLYYYLNRIFSAFLLLNDFFFFFTTDYLKSNNFAFYDSFTMVFILSGRTMKSDNGKNLMRPKTDINATESLRNLRHTESNPFPYWFPRGNCRRASLNGVHSTNFSYFRLLSSESGSNSTNLYSSFHC